MQGQGRARGKSRGRARGQPTQAGASGDGSRKPGEAPRPAPGGQVRPPQQQQQVPPQHQQQQQVPPQHQQQQQVPYQQQQQVPYQHQQRQQVPYQQPQGASHLQGPRPQVQPGGRGSQRQVGGPGGSKSAHGGGHRTGGGDAEVLAEKLQRIKLGETQPVAGAGSVGRGSLRGRREITPSIRTKPDTVTSKAGSYGNTVKLSANYFTLLTHTDWALYQYRVDFSPEEDRTPVRKALLRVHKQLLGGYIFDGTLLFTSHRLHPDPVEVHSSRQSDNEIIRITIKKAADLAMGDPHYIQFFNILMRKCLDHLDLQLVGRNYYDASARIEIPEYRLELWPGYVTSIRQHEENILMCAEITHKVMRQDTVFELLAECTRKNPTDYKKIFQQAIVGSVVLTGYNNNTYRIDDVDFDQKPSHTFQLKSKEKISYIDYYKKKYQLVIREVDQPLLISRAKARNVRAGMSDNVILVPELCRLTGLTDDMRSNFHLMRALADHTRVNPQNRILKLNQFSRRLNSTKAIQDDMTLWNMKLSSNLIEFNGRVFRPENILQGKGCKADAGIDADWTKPLRASALLLMGNLHSWAVLYPASSKRDLQGFIITLCKSAASLKFNIPQPQYEELYNDRSSTYVEALEKIISRLNPQLIMCIVPNNRADRYSAIKKKCCVDRAVPTQVVVAKNMTARGIMSIATKIAIQMNCKIGGAPWTVEMPLTGVMVVGYDVCHDTSSKGRSFGAMVASLDKTLSRYYSAVSHHTSGEELSNDISINICKAITKWKDVNGGVLPARIIIYRDGVGEGQIPYVFNIEVKMVEARLREIYGREPNMAFLIVTKRINTRLFLNNNNPPPGTIVDNIITSPDRYDFFLVSQSVKQGTVSPTAYNVIHDTAGLTPDRMQRFTYKMTHLYFNWSGTVRVPAQCQYAHKLAFLVGQSLHRPPHQQLDDLLYFL